MDIKAQLKQIQDKVLYRELQPIQSVEKQYIYINDQSYINFTSNDYLGIGQLEYQPQNFLDFIKTYSIHLSSSRLVSGNSVVYQQLEQAISEHFNFEDALILIVVTMRIWRYLIFLKIIMLLFFGSTESCQYNRRY